MNVENKNDEFTLESPIKGYELDEHLRSLTVPEYLLERVRQRGESKNRRPEYIVNAITGESRDFLGFDDETRKVASAMYKRGMRKFDTVVFMCHETFYTYTFFVGVWRANGILRAVYAQENEETVLERVEESRARWILCEPMAAEMCLSVSKKVNWDLEVIVTGKYNGCASITSLFKDDGAEMPALEIKSTDIAIIYCTSGTTGKSKGAVDIHRNYISMIETVARFFPLSAEKPNLLMTRPTITAGAVFGLGTIAAGKTILCDYFATRTNEKIFQAIQKYKPGMMWYFGPDVLRLVNDPDIGKYDLRSLDIILAGGAPFPPTLGLHASQLPNVKSIGNVYGLTELGPVTLRVNFENDKMEMHPDTPPSSAGKLVPGVSAHIRSLETHAILGPNQKGEIYIKSKHVFQYYLNNQKATNDAFENGWFRTGDVGYYDENGFLFVVDRIKDTFKYASSHIAPVEIENVIRQHPDVRDCGVIGILQPDGIERAPRAFVSLNNGSSASADDIRNFANGKLASYKQLREGLFIIPEIPKGPTGKLSRTLLQKLYSG